MKKLLVLGAMLPFLLSACGQQEIIACPAIAAVDSINVTVTNVDKDFIDTSGAPTQATIEAEVCKDDTCSTMSGYLMRDTEVIVETAKPSKDEDGTVHATIAPLDNGTLTGSIIFNEAAPELGDYDVTLTLHFPDKSVTTDSQMVTISENKGGTEQCPLISKTGSMQVDWSEFKDA